MGTKDVSIKKKVFLVLEVNIDAASSTLPEKKLETTVVNDALKTFKSSLKGVGSCKVTADYACEYRVYDVKKKKDK